MVTNILIENFKSIQKMDFDLQAINILIGANGAGKSNFIQFFQLLRNIYAQNLQHYNQEQAGANNILYFGIKNVDYLKGSITFDDTNKYEFVLKTNVEQNFYIGKEEISFRNKNVYSNWMQPTIISQSTKESVLKDSKGGISEYVKKYMNSFKIFHFHDTSSNSPIKQKPLLEDNHALKPDGGNLASFLYHLQENHQKNFKLIEKTIQSIAPYFECFELKPDVLNPNYIGLNWREKNLDSFFSVIHFSDGTLRFIALATLLLQPNPPKIILIDEPELGLHPVAINKLAGLIKMVSLKSQVIISTQSVNFIDNFSPENIITTDRKNNQSCFQRQNKENLAEWLQEYSMGDIWNKNVIGARP